ncbi:hypothetical protein [Streptomyces jeddahensis]|uniref:hypothetical protein n=1 Tax=Streptomyces jeddahensis TaxID=1716141 RepID=UPI0012FFA85D|nr:hypothetical protein [Streptomyces jeddahensis]
MHSRHASGRCAKDTRPTPPARRHFPSPPPPPAPAYTGCPAAGEGSCPDGAAALRAALCSWADDDGSAVVGSMLGVGDGSVGDGSVGVGVVVGSGLGLGFLLGFDLDGDACGDPGFSLAFRPGASSPEADSEGRADSDAEPLGCGTPCAASPPCPYWEPLPADPAPPPSGAAAPRGPADWEGDRPAPSSLTLMQPAVAATATATAAQRTDGSNWRTGGHLRGAER